MIRGLWGKKIGMTQIFKDDHTVIPVTVIDTSSWLVTQIKTQDSDGYSAIQVGLLRDKYNKESFVAEWLKSPKKYFSFVREIKIDNGDQFKVGQRIEPWEALQEGSLVDVTGITIGRGFAGAMKRWNFAGGRSSHGSTFHRAPGSMGFMRSQGRVIKGKKLPGHMGVTQRVMKNLEIIKVDSNAQVILVKGSVPGKSGSLVFVRKNG